MVVAKVLFEKDLPNYIYPDHKLRLLQMGFIQSINALPGYIRGK